MTGRVRSWWRRLSELRRPTLLELLHPLAYTVWAPMVPLPLEHYVRPVRPKPARDPSPDGAAPAGAGLSAPPSGHPERVLPLAQLTEPEREMWANIERSCG
jgi:hypothetical protein